MALDTSHPQPGGGRDVPPTPTTGGWQYVRDLPTPPEVASLIDAKCRGHGRLWRWWNKRLLESATDDLKLQYHFAGKVVALMETDRGPVVIAVADDRMGLNVPHLRESLPRTVWERTVILSFPRWNDDTTVYLGLDYGWDANEMEDPSR